MLGWGKWAGVGGVTAVLAAILLVAIFLTVVAIDMSTTRTRPARANRSIMTIRSARTGRGSILSVGTVTTTVIIKFINTTNTVNVTVTVSGDTRDVTERPRVTKGVGSAVVLNVIFVRATVVCTLVITVLVVFILWRKRGVPLGVSFFRVLLRVLGFIVLTNNLSFLLFGPIGHFLRRHHRRFTRTRGGGRGSTRRGRRLHTRCRRGLQSTSARVSRQGGATRGR